MKYYLLLECFVVMLLYSCDKTETGGAIKPDFRDSIIGTYNVAHYYTNCYYNPPTIDTFDSAQIFIGKKEDSLIDILCPSFQIDFKVYPLPIINEVNYSSSRPQNIREIRLAFLSKDSIQIIYGRRTYCVGGDQYSILVGNKIK